MYRFLIPSFGLALLIAFLSGAIFNAWIVHQAPSLSVVTDISRPSISTVRIDGIRNGTLVGVVTGDVRLIARNHLIIPAANGSFSIADTTLLTNIVEIHIPEGMQFVASKRGKKYYPVHSASAGNLSPANRIYFPSSQAAEAAGYIR